MLKDNTDDDNKFLQRLNAALSPPRLVLILGLTFGLLWLIITPPFQAPDENEHFLRAYQMSCGKIISVWKGDAIGGYFSRRILDTVNDINPGMPEHPGVKQDIHKVFSFLKHPPGDETIQFRILPLFDYTPVGYLPHIAGLLLGKLFRASPLLLLYLGRLANLLFWIALIFLSLKITPGKQTLFLLIAFMPMNLFMASTFSQDGFINSVSLLYIAIVLHLARPETKLNRNRLLLILFLSLAITLTKSVYIVLTFLFLIIPMEKFASGKRYIAFFALMVFTSLLSYVIWHNLIHGVVGQVFSVCSPELQTKFILTHPLKIFQVTAQTFWAYKTFYIASHIGKLGWLDTPLPWWVIISYLLALLFISVYNGSYHVDRRKKIVFAGTILIGVLGVNFALYLLCTPVGAKYVIGLQGRYYIIFAPLFWMLFDNKIVKEKVGKIKYLNLAVLFFLIVILTTTTVTLLQRYYAL
ncbi:MAG: DUF2142 domain-containing protein [Calditrichaeota bacterium]|nr:DUF2142 domain-containing protein [Calditrichota bacterium]